MSEKRLDLEIPSVDDLFKVSDDNKNKIVKIPIYQIEDFPEHPFKVKRDEELNKLAESIKEHGVFNPVIVREIGDRHYEMISGHRRKEASKLAGKQEINAIIENVDDDTATIMMVDSNMQREKVLPSERAFAYKMKLEAMKHQGKKFNSKENSTSLPLETKLRSNELVGSDNGDSGVQVSRYIRLTYLIPEILDMVDEEKIAFRPAVEISYLTDEEQYQLLDAMELNEATPSLATTELYKISGHWDHYKDDMFPVMKMDNEEMVLRPMNCPHHMLIYKNELHSYKDLPIRIAEIAHDFRYENSGAVLGLERVRQMTQNDSHIFVRPDQIKDEIGNVIKLIKDVYINDFHFPEDAFKYRLSLRDKNDKKKYIDNDEMWDTAEDQLRTIMKELNLNFYEAVGEAAFYGPKIDVQIKTALNHDVTIPTAQLDFALPERFDLKYIGEDGEDHRPVVIHRAILGSTERFMSFLLEETKGNLPVWLAPHQVKILPISEKFIDYANEIKNKLLEEDFRVDVDSRSEKIGYKIREAELLKVPYMIIVGEKEQSENKVSVRKRHKENNELMSVDEFINKLKDEVETKAKD